jgi:hypothetical protein
VRILYLIIVILSTNTAYAGWFGPDNYEDCILEKMRGQHKNMIHTARIACEKSFPYEKIIYNKKYNDGNIFAKNYKKNEYYDAVELSVADGMLTASFEDGDNKYRITNVKAILLRKKEDSVKCFTAEVCPFNTRHTFKFEASNEAQYQPETEYESMMIDTISGILR